LDLPIVVSTSKNKLDDKIEELCTTNNIPCYRGEEDDVIGRIRDVAITTGFNNIVRLPGDNPITSHTLLKESIDSHRLSFADLTTTRILSKRKIIKRVAPKGLSIDILKSSKLVNVSLENLDDYSIEHVIPVFFKGGYKIKLVKTKTNYNDCLSIDSYKDFYRVESFAKKLIANDKLNKYIGKIEQ